MKIEIDQSESVKVTATFPYLNDHMEEDVMSKNKISTVTKDYLNKELKIAQSKLGALEDDYPELDALKVEEIRTGLNELMDNIKTSDIIRGIVPGQDVTIVSVFQFIPRS